MELKKEQEAESNRANALAEKVIFEAGKKSISNLCIFGLP